MPLVQRLSPVESIQNLEQAAEQRFWEGLELAQDGYGQAGIYLVGYAIEMLLKAGYYRFEGALATDLADGYFGRAKAAGQMFGILPAFWLSGHGLGFWQQLLCLARINAGRPLAMAVEQALVDAVAAISDNWRVEMRYQLVTPTVAEVNEVFINAEWVRENYDKLWRSRCPCEISFQCSRTSTEPLYVTVWRRNSVRPRRRSRSQ
jgi:hypothetical protein